MSARAIAYQALTDALRDAKGTDDEGTHAVNAEKVVDALYAWLAGSPPPVDCTDIDRAFTNDEAPGTLALIFIAKELRQFRAALTPAFAIQPNGRIEQVAGVAQAPRRAEIDLSNGGHVDLNDSEGRETVHHCEACGWPLRQCDRYSYDGEDGVALCVGCVGGAS